MVDFDSPAIAAKTGAILIMFSYISTGCFLADTISSASFDWSLISGKKERKWMHLIYFGAKLSLLVFLIQNFTAYWIEKEIDCQAFMISIEFMMGMAVIFSSVLLSFRTIVVNSINGTILPVKWILVVAGLGLMASWLQGIKDVKAVWLTEVATLYTEGTCVPVHIKETYFGELLYRDLVYIYKDTDYFTFSPQSNTLSQLHSTSWCWH